MLVSAILCVFIGKFQESLCLIEYYEFKILASGLSAAQSYPKGTCGLRPLVTKAMEEEQGKIVGGTQAVAGDWPWSVCIDQYFPLIMLL